MNLPPSRYKVVEQGRRLVVLDTWNGNTPVAGHGPRPELPAESARPATVEQARAALHPGRPPAPVAGPRPDPVGNAEAGVLVTQSWFDNEAPRRVRVEQDKLGMFAVAGVALLVFAVLLFSSFGWPALLVAAIIVAQKGTRSALRSGVTRWLNGLDQLGPG
ncbi:MAG: hypothetical protein V4574_07660 [Pseudomonadota bacterium]